MLSRHVVRRVGTFAVAACLPLAAMAQSVGVNWRTNLDAAKIEAAQSGRLLLLHFTTRKCYPCKMLDTNVFSQPQVAAAMEQDFVPVRIDADASPALAAAFRIEVVPTEIIMTPEGRVLTSPPIPKEPEPFVAQLQNMARHCRQAANAAQPGAAAANVNAAYANVGVSQPPAAMAPAAGAAPMASPPLAAPQSQPATQPQAQANPYVSAAPASVYGQAQSVYAPPSAQPGYAAPPQQAVPQQQASMQQPPVASPSQAMAEQTPAMPTNAMPRSYRDPALDAAAAATAAAPAIGAMASPYPATGSAAASGADLAQAAIAGAGATAAVAAATPKPQKPEQPPGAPPLAFEGCCPVTLKTVKKWAYGDAQFGAVHRGRTYLFTGGEQRDQFLADPDAYAPVFAGLDPVLLIDRQQSIEGSRDFGYEYGGLFYLFSSKESMQRFAESPHTYAAGVRQAMNRIDSASDTRLR